MRVENDYLIFESGNRVYCNCGIVGIEEGLCISEGYDGSIPEHYLSTQDKIELATYMIGLWEAWVMKWTRGDRV